MKTLLTILCAAVLVCSCKKEDQEVLKPRVTPDLVVRTPGVTLVIRH